jgi:hypothetical protein
LYLETVVGATVLLAQFRQYSLRGSPVVTSGIMQSLQ